jgi:hypothetical protein
MKKISYELLKEKVDTDEILDLVFKDSSVKHGLQEFSKDTLKRINAFKSFANLQQWISEQTRKTPQEK